MGPGALLGNAGATVEQCIRCESSAEGQGCDPQTNRPNFGRIENSKVSQLHSSSDSTCYVILFDTEK